MQDLIQTQAGRLVLDDDQLTDAVVRRREIVRQIVVHISAHEQHPPVTPAARADVTAGDVTVAALAHEAIVPAPAAAVEEVSLISIVIMLMLIYGKIKTGKALHSDALLADANCTKVCIYMSCVLLASSAIYEGTGFAYADAIGTLGLAWFSFKEGQECFEKAKTGKDCVHDH